MKGSRLATNMFQGSFACTNQQDTGHGKSLRVLLDKFCLVAYVLLPEILIPNAQSGLIHRCNTLNSPVQTIPKNPGSEVSNAPDINVSTVIGEWEKSHVAGNTRLTTYSK